jgi:hypothetical protein
MRTPSCGSAGPNDAGCGRVLHWDSPASDKGDPDPYVAIRCLDCGVILCPSCARKHFAYSDEKDKQIETLRKAYSELATDPGKVASVVKSEKPPLTTKKQVLAIRSSISAEDPVGLFQLQKAFDELIAEAERYRVRPIAELKGTKPDRSVFVWSPYSGRSIQRFSGNVLWNEANATHFCEVPDPSREELGYDH